jgi:hypothetical protein
MISLARYSSLLAHPDFKSVLIASIIGRLPIGVTGLSILLLAQGATGSFARGGTAACCLCSRSCLFRTDSRTHHRSIGPRSVLVWCSIAFPVSLIALVAAVRSEADGVLLPLAAAFAAGANFPPITVCMRTFFRRRLAESICSQPPIRSNPSDRDDFHRRPGLVAFFVAYMSCFGGSTIRCVLRNHGDAAFSALAGVAQLADRSPNARQSFRPAG